MHQCKEYSTSNEKHHPLYFATSSELVHCIVPLKTTWDFQHAAEDYRPRTVCDLAMLWQQGHINEGQVPVSDFCWHSNMSFGSYTTHWSPRLKVPLIYQSEIRDLAVKGKNLYRAHNCTHTDLFTGEGAIILVVPSFSPFSMLAITRFMLFDPGNKTKTKMG